MLPQVALSGGYQYLDNQFLDDDTVGMAGIGVQWAMFDGGQSRKRAAALDRNRRASEQQRADAAGLIELQVRQAYLGIAEARQRVAVTAQAAEQADENLRIARERYTAGLGTQTQLLEAETLRVQSLRNSYEATLDVGPGAAAARARRRGALRTRRTYVAGLERSAGSGALAHSGSTAHRESRRGTARFTASLARTGSRRWWQRANGITAVPPRACARAAASDTE